MSDEHDSWLTSAFGLDIRGTLKVIAGDASAAPGAVPAGATAVALAGAPVNGPASAASSGGSPSLGDQLKQGLRNQFEDAKASARETLLSGLGTAKGVAIQVTEAADTAMWAASEVRDGAAKLRQQAHEFVAGPEASTRRKVIDTLFAAPPVAEQPCMDPIDTLAYLSDEAKKAGLVDERSNASISTPMSKKLDTAARWIEDKVGGKPAEPETLSTMAKEELSE
jgi:hypothetical protein